MASEQRAFVLGVCGSAGGLGASTLTVALALTAVREGWKPVVAVDGSLGGGGLDVTAGAEHLPGLRWTGLAGALGQVDGRAVLAELPEVGGARVLSATAGGATPHRQVVESVLAALRSEGGLIVVDAPCDVAGEPFLQFCDAALLLAGVSARRLADASAVTVDAMRHCSELWLVVREGARGTDLPNALSAHLDLPLAGRWCDERRLAIDADHGRTPGERRRSPVVALCRQVLDRVVASWPGAEHPGAAS